MTHVRGPRVSGPLGSCLSMDGNLGVDLGVCSLHTPDFTPVSRLSSLVPLSEFLSRKSMENTNANGAIKRMKERMVLEGTHVSSMDSNPTRRDHRFTVICRIMLSKCVARVKNRVRRDGPRARTVCLAIGRRFLPSNLAYSSNIPPGACCCW